MVLTLCGLGSIILHMDQSFSKLVMTQQDCEGIEFVLEKADVTLGRATVNEIVLLHDSESVASSSRIDKKEARFTIWISVPRTEPM